jgi:uncharacterized SAM-binding protein YcdF (DUF218 family)
VIDVLKFLATGTTRLFVVVAAVGAILLWAGGGYRRLGALITTLMIGSYVVLSLPWTADRLSGELTRFDRLRDPGQAQGADLLVLGGDREDERILEALRLDRLLHPRRIFVSGNMGLRELLVEAGVRPDRIILETNGKTTREQAIDVADMLQAFGTKRVVLVASVVHMPRALAAFRAVGVDAIPSVSASWPIDGLARFWPAANARRLSRDAIYELAALRYYRRRGWL